MFVWLFHSSLKGLSFCQCYYPAMDAVKVMGCVKMDPTQTPCVRLLILTFIDNSLCVCMHRPVCVNGCVYVCVLMCTQKQPYKYWLKDEDCGLCLICILTLCLMFLSYGLSFSTFSFQFLEQLNFFISAPFGPSSTPHTFLINIAVLVEFRRLSSLFHVYVLITTVWSPATPSTASGVNHHVGNDDWDQLLSS